MGKKQGPNKENLEATRRNFLKVARKEFATKGYYNASTGSIVEASNMARGSLYYHFGDKKGLFQAVYLELMEEMRDIVSKKVKSAPTSWDSLMAACLGVLDLCMKDETRRIVVDVHTALTYGERFEILQKTLLDELRGILRSLKDQGYFEGLEVNTLSMIIFGIISESGRSFEVANDIPKARIMIGEAFVFFMEKARGEKAKSSAHG